MLSRQRPGLSDRLGLRRVAISHSIPCMSVSGAETQLEA